MGRENRSDTPSGNRSGSHRTPSQFRTKTTRKTLQKIVKWRPAGGTGPATPPSGRPENLPSRLNPGQQQKESNWNSERIAAIRRRRRRRRRKTKTICQNNKETWNELLREETALIEPCSDAQWKMPQGCQKGAGLKQWKDGPKKEGGWEGGWKPTAEVSSN